jgi:D-glycero-D-manno-heptose 1,7-bisphosphate phosphatase
MSALADPTPVRSATSPAIFVDRRWLEALRSAETDELAAAAAVLRRLRDVGHRIVVASNESRVGTGELDEAAVQADDRDLAARLALAAGVAVVDRFYWCPFDPSATLANYRRDHAWRKPRPGMLLQAASDLELDLDSSWVIAGDEDDLAAARAAGCRVATIGRLARASDAGATSITITSADFSAAADAILKAGDGSVAPSRSDTSTTAPPRVVDLPTASSEGANAMASPSTTNPAPARNAPRPRGPASPDTSREKSSGPRPGESDSALAGAMRDLAEELRLHRQAARDLTGGRVLAILLQLGVLLTAVMGLLQLADPAHFTRWFLGAILLQATAIALLLFDRR